MNPKIMPEPLHRGDFVYGRQSPIGQVLEHTESKRRQYVLADSARQPGFVSASIIDDGRGRSGSGLVERPGFCWDELGRIELNPDERVAGVSLGGAGPETSDVRGGVRVRPDDRARRSLMGEPAGAWGTRSPWKCGMF